MTNVKHLLREATEQFPPAPGMRHNITFDGERLELTLMLASGYEPYILDDSDLERLVDDLIGEITISRRML